MLKGACLGRGVLPRLPPVCAEQNVGAGEHPILLSLPRPPPRPRSWEPLGLSFSRVDATFVSGSELHQKGHS